MESIFFPSPPSSTPPPPPSPIGLPLLTSSFVQSHDTFSRLSIRKTFVPSVYLARIKGKATRREREGCKRAPTFLFLRARRKRRIRRSSKSLAARVFRVVASNCSIGHACLLPYEVWWNVAYPRERMADNEWRVCPAIIRITLEPFNRRDNTPFVGG